MKSTVRAGSSNWFRRSIKIGVLSFTIPISGLYLTELIVDITTTPKTENREDRLRVTKSLKKVIDEERARLGMKEEIKLRLSYQPGWSTWETKPDGSRGIILYPPAANPTTVRHELWHEFRGHKYGNRKILGVSSNSGLGKILDEFEKWCLDEPSAIFYSLVVYRCY